MKIFFSFYLTSINLTIWPVVLNYLNSVYSLMLGVVGCGEGVMYLMSLGHPTDIGLQLGKACHPCSR